MSNIASRHTLGGRNGERCRERNDPFILLAAARLTLTRVWLIGTGVSALILIVSSILRGQTDTARETWSWFLPLVLPTIGLMVGVLGAAAMLRQPRLFVRKSFSDIAFWLSVAYLTVLLLTIALEPFSPLSGAALHGMSNYWMGPFQGLVVAALGYLFTSGERETALSVQKSSANAPIDSQPRAAKVEQGQSPLS
jgi:hypothetical protein